MKKIAIAIAGVLIFSGCYNDKADKLYPKTAASGCDSGTVSFQAGVLPIMSQSCGLAGCHDAGTPSFGYNLTLYSGVKLAVSNGRLLGAIKHEPTFQAMPKNMPKLDDCSIKKITRWVDQGALDN
jgi:hypothetical protein